MDLVLVSTLIAAAALFIILTLIFMGQGFYKAHRSARIFSEQYQEAQRTIATLQAALQHNNICIITGENFKDFGHAYGQIALAENQGLKELIKTPTAWLEAQEAQIFEEDLAHFLQEGKAFDKIFQTKDKKALHIRGHILHSQAVLFCQTICPKESQQIERGLPPFLAQHSALFPVLLDAMPNMVWVKDSKGQILWANAAYSKTVGKSMPPSSAEPQLLPDIFGQDLQKALATKASFAQGIESARTFQGQRHYFKLLPVAHHLLQEQGLQAAYTMDYTNYKHLQEQMRHMYEGYGETLNLLPTAISIFDAQKKLKFFNEAFANLWPLENAFLESMPSHTLLLERLREMGLLAEQRDWRAFKENLFKAYHSFDTMQHIWNLPDGRTLRVLAHPHPDGGVTFLYENLTEKLHLETRYNTLIKIQGETLDHLSEGVVVFGSDGRLRLANSAFRTLWNLPYALLVQGTPIQNIKEICDAQLEQKEWEKITNHITGFAEHREIPTARIELNDGRVFDYALAPLPDCQMLLTFMDVTANVRYARTLQEKNNLLQAADQLRNDFVQHVSYELRTPLTNIIGFTELLALDQEQQLKPKQKSYIADIAQQSEQLLNIVNDILDLATVDAGMMELDIAPIAIKQLVTNAVQRAKKGAGHKFVEISIFIEQDLPSFYADRKRVQQVLVKLLENALAFSPEGSIIHLHVYKEEQALCFSVSDEGPGIAPSIIDSVFKRFLSHSSAGQKTGAGLGLSIVKTFVELHGGKVRLQTTEGKGTKIICSFPLIGQQQIPLREQQKPLLKQTAIALGKQNDDRN